MCCSDFKQQQAAATSKPAQTSNNVKNQLLNWLIEFMGLIRTISTSEKYTPEVNKESYYLSSFNLIYGCLYDFE